MLFSLCSLLFLAAFGAHPIVDIAQEIEEAYEDRRKQVHEYVPIEAKSIETSVEGNVTWKLTDECYLDRFHYNPRNYIKLHYLVDCLKHFNRVWTISCFNKRVQSNNLQDIGYRPYLADNRVEAI